jgi:hypothetical protein
MTAVVSLGGAQAMKQSHENEMLYVSCTNQQGIRQVDV